MRNQMIKEIISSAVPLPITQCDTDQIIPARFLKESKHSEWGKYLFYDRRYGPDGGLVKDFVLNDSAYRGEILIAGENFGCGSSREHAVWALRDYGFSVVISSRFADIFMINALNNFLLPIEVEDSELAMLLDVSIRNSIHEIRIDVDQQLLEAPEVNMSLHFELNSYKKQCLLTGQDDIELLQRFIPEIQLFEKATMKNL